MGPSEVGGSLRGLRLRERGHAARPAAGAAVQPNCAGERPLERILVLSGVGGGGGARRRREIAGALEAEG